MFKIGTKHTSLAVDLMIKHFIFRQFLEEEEKIVRCFRSPFPFWKLVWWSALSSFMFIFIWWIGFDLKINIANTNSVGFYFFVSFVVIYLFRVLQIWRNWYINTILMTSECLIFIDWKSFFSPKSIRLDYWDLDAVEVEKKGFWSYLTNHGKLSFMKIAGGAPIVFSKASRPYLVEKIVSAHKEKMLDAKNFTEESTLKELISQMVQTKVRKDGLPQKPDKDSKKTIEKQNKNEGRSFFRNIFSKKKPTLQPPIRRVFDDEGGANIEI